MYKQEVTVHLSRLLDKSRNVWMDRAIFDKVFGLTVTSNTFNPPSGAQIEASREDVQQLLRTCYQRQQRES